jgi:hypothetical protein
MQAPEPVREATLEEVAREQFCYLAVVVAEQNGGIASERDRWMRCVAILLEPFGESKTVRKVKAKAA